MAHKDKKSTLLRQWEMLRQLTVSRSDSREGGRWDRASEIAGRLRQAGYPVSLRTVQRDLKELSEIFPIELNSVNPLDYGWRWRKGANLDIPGMAMAEALGLRLVELHMRPMLPEPMVQSMEGLFDLANQKLKQTRNQGTGRPANWLDKVRHVPATQPLLAPIVAPEVHAAICQALLESRQIDVAYHAMDSNEASSYRLHPLGLIARGVVLYLAATAWDYQDVRLYAFHRFAAAVVTERPVQAPAGFDLDRAIANGLAEFADRGVPIELELRCAPSVARYLKETPLAADQRIEACEDGWMQLRASTNDTWQLRWWLLSQGAGLEICSPECLRKEIAETLAAAAAQYNGSG